MKISILTLFPKMFSGPFDASIIKRAKDASHVEINLVDIRNFGLGKHKVVDDKPFGGGIGMVMRVDVLNNAINHTRDSKLKKNEEECVLLDARGETYKQSSAVAFSRLKHLIIICGHYEGVDARIRSFVDKTISIGDFILTGGEIPAMAITDSVTRLVSGVLKTDATNDESFSQSKDTLLLEYPQYTLPREYNGMKVPDILLSGNHKEIQKWKNSEALKITEKQRPDLIKG